MHLSWRYLHSSAKLLGEAPSLEAAQAQGSTTVI